MRRSRLVSLTVCVLAFACGRASSSLGNETTNPCDTSEAGCVAPGAGAQNSVDGDAGGAREPDWEGDGPDGASATIGAGTEGPLPGERECDARVPLYNQASLDALEGCSVIVGNLSVAFAEADLRPLHALTRVTGTLLLTAPGESGQGIGIDSLEGLEQLESVHQLFIDGVSAPTLGPLRGLRTVGRVVEQGYVEGELILSRMVNLRNLDGLQNLALDRVVLDLSDNANLETLQPLVFPPAMLGRLLVRSNPKLASLGDFGGVESLEYLHVQGSALTDLDDLVSLRRALVLQVNDNPLLRDAQGLASVQWTHFFLFAQHPEVTVLPDFGGMVQAGFVSISQNAQLRALPSFPLLTQLSGDWSGELILEDNPSLEEIDGFAALESADVIRVQRNESLTRMDLPSLQAVHRRLVVTANPALQAGSLASLAAVAVPDAKVAGNEPDAPLLNPCPWVADEACDAAPTSTLCAAGTDEQDCRRPAF